MAKFRAARDGVDLIRNSKTQLSTSIICAILLLACILAAPPAARCQIGKSFQPKNEFGVWGAYSVNNPYIVGSTRDAQLGDLAFRYTRILANWSSVAVYYTVDILPVEVVRQPLGNGHEVVYGGGLDPIGFKANFFRHHKLQLFGAGSVGCVASLKPVPVDVPTATQFNFTFDVGLGLQRFNRARTRAWMFGWKFKHISNAQRSNINPGLDVSMLYIGYSFFK